MHSSFQRAGPVTQLNVSAQSDLSYDFVESHFLVISEHVIFTPLSFVLSQSESLMHLSSTSPEVAHLYLFLPSSKQ